MFGYVTIHRPELKIKDEQRYRAFYCGLCRSLRDRYGRSGQTTLSYDMTFLAMLLSALYEPETQDGPPENPAPGKENDTPAVPFG